MALQPRTQYGKFDGRKVRTAPGAEYDGRATFEDREDDNSAPDGLADTRAAGRGRK